MTNITNITYIPDHIYDTVFLRAIEQGIRLYDEKFTKYNLRLKELTENRNALDPTAEDSNGRKFTHAGISEPIFHKLYLVMTFTKEDVLYKYAMVKADSLDYIERHLVVYLSYVLNGESADVIDRYFIIKFADVYDKYIAWSECMADFKAEQTSQVIYQSKDPIKYSAINKFGEIFYFDPLLLDNNSKFDITSTAMPELKSLSVDNLWLWYFYPMTSVTYGFIIADSEEEAWKVIRENNIYQVGNGDMIDNGDDTVSPAYSIVIKSLSDNRSYIGAGSKINKEMYEKENALKNFIEDIAFLIKDTEISIVYGPSRMTVPFNAVLQKYRNAVEFLKHSNQSVNISEITSVFAQYVNASGYKLIYEKDLWLWAFEPYSVSNDKYGFVYGNGQDGAVDNLVSASILECKESDVKLYNLLDIMDIFDKSNAMDIRKVICVK